jgi:NADH-quinone oxidoreductase subunit F
MEEGVEMSLLANPVKIGQEGGHLVVTCIRMELGEPDASGRRRPVPVKGSEFTQEYDTVIAAIGQVPDVPESFNVKLGRGNTIQGDPFTQATGMPGVWTGGDCHTGPDSVIRAIAAGRRAAADIDKYLGGTGNIEEELTSERQFDMHVGKEEGFVERSLVAMPCLPLEKRQGFIEVELGFSEEEGLREARRCLQCGVRLQIPPAPLPPERTDHARVSDKSAAAAI